MDLVALLIINIIIAVILYYAISIRVTSNVKDFQNRKLLKEVDNHIATMFEESENYLNLLDSRIVIIRNLLNRLESEERKIRKTEGVSVSSEILKEKIKLDEYSGVVLDEISHEYRDIPAPQKNTDPVQNELPKKPEKEKIPASRSKSPENASVDWIASLGRGVKSMFGVTDISASSPENQKPLAVKTSKHDYTVSGDPFSESKTIKNNKDQMETFREVFDAVQSGTSYRANDSINLSLKVAMKDLPENASKIDKVVYLLRKGFLPSEVSDELGIPEPEIDLIKTFRMDKR